MTSLPEFDDRIWKMSIVGAFLVWLLIFLLSSCTTEKKAVKYFNNNAFSASRYCAASFPCVDGLLTPGIVNHIIDTITLAGKTIPCTTDTGQTVVIACPPSYIVQDSIFRVDTLKVLDSAIINYLAGQKDSLVHKIAIVSKDRDRLKNGRNTWRLIALPLMAGFLVLIVLKFKI